MGSHSPIRRWVPPMLNVALAELMCRRAQKMLTRQRRFSVDKRHRVLQLVAKSECPTGLIKAGPSPKTTAQYLIQQPAVGHQVYRCVGSFHVDRAKRLLPILPNAFESCSGGTGVRDSVRSGFARPPDPDRLRGRTGSLVPLRPPNQT